MRRVLATRTDRYARDKAYLPQELLIKGVEYDLDDAIAARVIELEGGEYVTDEIETPEDGLLPLEGDTPGWNQQSDED